MNKDAFFRSFVKNMAENAGESVARGALGQVRSQEAAALIRNTLKGSWLPIAASGAALGVATGFGFGFGRRLSRIGMPEKVDPSTFHQPQPPTDMNLTSGAGDIHKLGAIDAMTKIALAKAFGGLSSMAPATNSVLGTTMARSRAQIRNTNRAVVKPVSTSVGKATDVKTSVPAPPQVGPATITSTQQPATVSTKTGALKRRDRTSAGEPKTGGRPQRPGEDMRTRRSEPSNEPLTFTSGKPHDF